MGSGKRGKRVRLVCGVTSMYNGLDGLTSIIRYQLRCNPYDGSIYVFRDCTGSMLKYIEWDGQGFLQGKRRAQSGTYPWPNGEAGRVVEISEKEFTYIRDGVKETIFSDEVKIYGLPAGASAFVKYKK